VKHLGSKIAIETANTNHKQPEVFTSKSNRDTVSRGTPKIFSKNLNISVEKLNSFW
jgi:hypothetical protein